MRESSLHFVGNVESNAIFGGEVDVVVADGFVGNVVLKTIEGAVKFMGSAIKEEFNRKCVYQNGRVWARCLHSTALKSGLDPRRFNGDDFLGIAWRGHQKSWWHGRGGL